MAPGSPWNTIFFKRGIGLFGYPADMSMAGAVEVGGRVDAERDRVDDRHVDAHAGLERAELLELLALLERRRRQGDIALERRAAIGVEADVMIERPVARGAVARVK